jgi:negative regulator of replication initiation
VINWQFVAEFLPRRRRPVVPVIMKNIEISEEVYTALQKLANGFNQTPNAVLASLLNVSAAPRNATDPLAAYVVSADFRGKFTDADKYLAILGWVAVRHAAEFSEFIRAQSGGRRYLSLSPQEILETCQHNQARQIAGTPYWAIMNIDTATKRRFLARVLEFTGYREEIIEFVCHAIGMRRVARRGRFAALVA